MVLVGRRAKLAKSIYIYLVKIILNLERVVAEMSLKGFIVERNVGWPCFCAVNRGEKQAHKKRGRD